MKTKRNQIYKTGFNHEEAFSYLILNDLYKQHLNSEYIITHSFENYYYYTLYFCQALQFTCIIAFEPHDCCEDQAITFSTDKGKNWVSFEVLCDRASFDYNLNALFSTLCWAGNYLRKSTRWYYTTWLSLELKETTCATWSVYYWMLQEALVYFL